MTQAESAWSWDECYARLQPLSSQMSMIHIRFPKKDQLEQREALLQPLRNACNRIHERLIEINMQRLKEKKHAS